MKKNKELDKEDLRAEYKRSDFPTGFVRGKYAERLRKASNIVVLKPERKMGQANYPHSFTSFPGSARECIQKSSASFLHGERDVVESAHAVLKKRET